MEISVNASASSFGWEFQSNAAIVLMLENIKEATAARVEAATEDIEISLANGKKIYSQAKSVINPESTANLKEKLVKGLSTLNSASKKEDTDRLVYVTNSPNPFNKKTTMYAFTGMTTLSFSELPEVCRNEITKIVSSNKYTIDLNKLEIHTIPYYGMNLNNRYKEIQTRVEEFLDMVGLNDSGLSKRVLEIWQRDFAVNSTMSDTKVKITKKAMIWPVIVLRCESVFYERLLDDFDDGAIEEIKRIYSKIIDSRAEEYTLLAKVIGDYDNYISAAKGNEKVMEFINNRYTNYRSEFSVDGIEQDILDIIIKVTLYKIITKRFEISRIAKEVTL